MARTGGTRGPVVVGALVALGLALMAHPLALQLRTLQTLVEIGVDKNTMVVVPAPLVSTIQELGGFLAKETTAATPVGVTHGGPMFDL